MVIKSWHLLGFVLLGGFIAGWFYGPIVPMSSPMIGAHKFKSIGATANGPAKIVPTPVPSFVSSAGPSNLAGGSVEQVVIRGGENYGLSCFIVIPGVIQAQQLIDNSSPVSSCSFSMPTTFNVPLPASGYAGVMQGNKVLRQYPVRVG